MLKAPTDDLFEHHFSHHETDNCSDKEVIIDSIAE